MNKPTGLAAFAKKGTAETKDADITARERGKGDVVSLTVRLPRSEWERLHQLAVSEGISINKLAIKGLSRLFAEKGLPPLQS